MQAPSSNLSKKKHEDVNSTLRGKLLIILNNDQNGQTVIVTPCTIWAVDISEIVAVCTNKSIDKGSVLRLLARQAWTLQCKRIYTKLCSSMHSNRQKLEIQDWPISMLLVELSAFIWYAKVSSMVLGKGHKNKAQLKLRAPEICLESWSHRLSCPFVDCRTQS